MDLSPNGACNLEALLISSQRCGEVPGLHLDRSELDERLGLESLITQLSRDGQGVFHVLSSVVPVPEVGGHPAQLKEAVPQESSVCIGAIDVGTELATGELPVAAELPVPREIECELAVLDALT